MWLLQKWITLSFKLHTILTIFSIQPEPTFHSMRLSLIAALTALALITGASPAANISFSITPPVADSNDIDSFTAAAKDRDNLLGNGSSDGGTNDGGTYIARDRAHQGQTFTSGSDPSGYRINALWLRHTGYTANTNATYWRLESGGQFTLRLTNPSSAASGGFVLASETGTFSGGESGVPNPMAPTSGSTSNPNGTSVWIRFAFTTPTHIQPNTLYGIDITSTSDQLFFEAAGIRSAAGGDAYPGGSAYKGTTNGAPDPACNLLPGDRAFLVEMEGGTARPLGISPYATPLTSANPFPIERVRLLDSRFKQNQELHRTGYLAWLEPDRLLNPFRAQANLPQAPGATDLGGWEGTSGWTALRGHMAGHYLTAAAKMYAATADSSFLPKVTYLVQELRKCQDALGAQETAAGRPYGFLAAFPVSYFDTLETTPSTANVPFYTIHKILAGLLDAHHHCGSGLALDIAISMSDYHSWRVARLTPAQVEAMCATYGGNQEEWGGMNEALTDLYQLSRARGDANPQRHLDFARIFHRDWFINPLVNNQDQLAGLHANTHIPQVTGFARCASVLNTNDTQRERLYQAADHFWQMVINKHWLATGGNSYGERFRAAGEETGPGGSALSLTTAETCNTHNMLKLTAQLFARQPDTAYADYYEHALYNHILASLAPDNGMMTYFLPMLSGYFKTYNKQEGSCWCCTGTGIENTARYNEAIYFHKNDTLWVNLFIPSQLDWSEKGLTLKMETAFPLSGDVNLTTLCATPVSATVRLRVPAWVSATPVLTINGVAQGLAPAAGSWIELNRIWANGDKVKLSLPMGLRVDRAMDDPNQVSLFYGPILLAADLGTEGISGASLTTSGNMDLSMFGLITAPVLINGDAENPASWLTPDGSGPLHFTVAGAYGGQAARKTLAVRPFYDLHYTRYAVYFKMAAPSAVSSWTGGAGNPQWSDPANWTVPVVAERALGFDSPTGDTSNNNLAAGTLVNGIRFSASAGTHQIGGNAFDLAGDVVQDSSAPQRIDVPVNLRHGLVWRIDVNGGDFTLGGPLSGNGGFEKRGPGKLVLTGNSISSGPVRIAAGILQIGEGGSSGALEASSLEVTDGTSLVFDRSGDFQLPADISGAGRIIHRGPGTMNLLGVSTHSGATTVENGTLRVGSTPVTGLAHRWSFSGNLLDSIGTAHAGIVEVGANNATVGATSVTLQGGAQDTADYVQLGSGLLPKDDSPVTLEFWATQHSIQSWSRVFDIGARNTENLFLSWTWAYHVNRNRLEWRDTFSTNADDTFPPFTPGIESHIALVIEPGAGSSGNTRVTWYAAPAGASTLGGPRGSFETSNTLSNLADTHFWLGRSHYTDLTANASYNEVRLWNAALPQAALEQSHRLGPDSPPTVMTGLLPASSAIALSGSGRLDLAGTAQQVDSLAGTENTTLMTGGGKLTLHGGGNTGSTFAGSITGGGEIEVQGVLRLVGNASLAANLRLTNRGVLDIMTWNGTLPAGFVNHGSVLDRSQVKINQITRDTTGIRIGIQGYRGHGYRLQSKPDLGSGSWLDLGTPVDGNDAPLEFIHPTGAAAPRGFYRIAVSP